MTDAPKMFQLESFCLRQFDDPAYTGTKISFDPQEFEDRINAAFEKKNCQLHDGYAPFCKHLFLPNFTSTKVNCAAITPANQHLLRTDYESRTELELPVLIRWFDQSTVEPQVAEYLDIILYSREQITKENAAMDKPSLPTTSPWGIISVKAQSVGHELPMQPITMMRNALGKEEGGSGVPLDRKQYQASVDYWKTHAIIK